VSNFDLTGVTSLQSMFEGCAALEALDLGEPNTSGITNMSGLFKGCARLQAVDLSHFDTSRVTTMSGMFQGCERMEAIDVSLVSTSAATNLSRMFYGCSALGQLDLSGFDLSKVYVSTGLLGQCTALGRLTLPDTFGAIRYDAFEGVGTEAAPCLLEAPATLDFEFAASDGHGFLWKGGYFRFDTTGTAVLAATAAPVTAGRKTPLDVCLADDGERYDDFLFDVCLPSGFRLAKEGRKVLFAVSEQYAGHVTLEVTELTDSTYRIVGRNTGERIAGGETPLVTLQLIADESRCGQCLTGRLDGGRLCRTQYYDTTAPAADFALDVSPYRLGDVNHDGAISVVDIMLAVDHVMGRTSELFHLENADLDDEGSVTIADVMQVCSLVMGQ